MCELFGISSEKKIKCNGMLREFYSHGVEHPDGWGLATFYGNAVSLEKEPISSLDSVYLKNRLTDNIEETVLMAHIRKASVGSLEYKNSHPFALRDNYDRLWTLAHNGTIFESLVLEPYRNRQKGKTDSERILYYLIDRINAGQEKKQGALSAEERFQIVDDVIHTITPNNKVNLLIYDGDLFYVHRNHKNSLYMRQTEKTLLVCTKPLNEGEWEETPMNTLLAYRSGELAYTGEKHWNEYIKSEDQK